MTKKTKKISLGVSSAVLTAIVPIAAVTSCGIAKRDFATFYRYNRTEMNEYGSLASLNQRTFDPQFVNGNTVTERAYSSGRSMPLIRTKASGDNIAKVNNDITDVNPKDQIKWVEEQKEEIEYQGAKAIFGSNDDDENKRTWTNIEASNIGKNGSTSVAYKYYKFVIRDTQWVDINNRETKYKLNAKDYFYGMMRSLASAQSVRNNGRLNGKDLKELQFSSTSNLDHVDASTNNTNGYLLDLFDVDLNQTIADGKKLNDSSRDFVVSLTKKSNMILYSLFANNSYFSPAPSQKIDELADGSTKPEIKYGITTYGKDGQNFSGIKDILSVSPYFYTSYDFIKGYVLVKNKHYWDMKFVNDPKRITKYTYHKTPTGSDSQAEALARKTGYENGLESVLDKKAWNNSEIQREIRINADKYGAKLAKVFKVGLQNKLLWNPTMPSSIANEYNAKGIEAMYGKGITTQEKSLNDPQALNNFYNGNGVKVRQAMDAAYNWYAGAVAASGSTQKFALLSPLAPEQPTTEQGKTIWDLIIENNNKPNHSGTVDSSIWAKPTVLPTYKELKDRYNSENTEMAASKSPAFDKAKSLLKEVADNIQATSSNPAIIPLQTWGASDQQKDSSEIVQQWKNMISIFNEASDNRIVFKKVVPHSWSDHLKAFQNHTAEFQFSAWGNDYPAASSSLQGITTIDRTGIIVGQMLDEANQPQLKSLMKTYNIDPQVVKTITAADIYNIAHRNDEHPLSLDKLKLILAANALTSKGYLTKASDNKFMTETITYLQNHAVYYRPIIMKDYSSLVPDREMGGTTIKVYKKWLHKRTLKNGTEFLQDFSVDLD